MRAIAALALAGLLAATPAAPGGAHDDHGHHAHEDGGYEHGGHGDEHHTGDHHHGEGHHDDVHGHGASGGDGHGHDRGDGDGHAHHHHHSVEFGYVAICQMAGYREDTAEWETCVQAQRERVDVRLADLRESFRHACIAEAGHEPGSQSAVRCLEEKGREKKRELQEDLVVIRTDPTLRNHPRLRDEVEATCTEADAGDAGEMCLFRETLTYRNLAKGIVQELERDPTLHAQ